MTLRSQSLKKTLFEREKMLVSTFSPYPITRRQILDSPKLKEFADDNFKFDENGSMLSKRVENIVGKGEIAQCFQKACFPGASKGVIVWGWVITQYFQPFERKMHHFKIDDCKYFQLRYQINKFYCFSLSDQKQIIPNAESDF